MAGKRLSATISIGSVLEGSFSKNIGVLKSGLQEVSASIKAVRDRQKDLGRERDALIKQGQAVDHLDREYQDLERTLGDLIAKQRALEAASRAANRVGREFGNMTAEIGRLARNAAIGVGLVGGAIFKLADDTATLGDKVAKSADAIGMGVEAFQELRYAAERSGVNIATFDSSMVAFSKRLGEAAEGTGAAADALEKLGLSAQDLINMAPEDVLELVAERMQGIETPAERAAIAADLFSRAGVGMVNMLRDGSAGLQQLREDAQATGYVLSEEAARDAETFKDRLLDAQLTVKGLKNTIGAELMPVVTEMMVEFGTFMRNNRDDVTAFAEALAGGLRDAVPVIGQIVSGLADVSSIVGQGVAALADFVGGWENLGAILGVVMASKAIAAVGRFGASVWSLGRAMLALGPAMPAVAAGIKAIGVALAANPIGLAVAAIAAGAALILTNWEAIEPKIRPILDGIGAAFTSLRSAAEPVIDWVVGAADAFVASWQAAGGTIQGILDGIGAAFAALMDAIRPVIDAVKWLVGTGASEVNAVTREIERPSANFVGPMPAQPSPDARAVGGTFHGTRPLLVGEKGPELLYPRQPGFVAHNRHLNRLADLSERAAGALGAAGGPASVSNVTQNITINALAATAAEVAAEVERRRQEASELALYDRPRGVGQYGGAHV